MVKKLSYISNIFASIIVCLVACNKQEEVPISDDKIFVSATAGLSPTKVTLSGNKLTWDKNDNLGVYVENAQADAKFISRGDGRFEGFFNKNLCPQSNRKVFSYYPYSNQRNSDISNTIVCGELSNVQFAPFDPSSDYMVADVRSIDYDEQNMPEISLSFNHHLFSILCINYSNTDENISSQKITGIRIESNSKILSGHFSFDVSQGNNSVAIFDPTKGDLKKNVDISYATLEELGLHKNHKVYAIIPPGEYPSGDLTVTIFTEKEKVSLSTKKALSLKNGVIYELESINFGSLERTDGVKTILCFGDSITTGTVTEQLQELLGCGWRVYIAGVAGNQVIPIMARQGTAPLYVRGGFVLNPDKGAIVEAGTSFLTTLHTDATFSDIPDNPISVTLDYYTRNAQMCGMTNPFLVEGVKCEISSSGGKIVIKRLESGPKINCSEMEYVKVIPYAAWYFGKPTVTTVYMGANGDPYSGQPLANMYKLVKSNVSPNGFIGIGYHHGPSTADYKTYMTSALGDNFLDLRAEGCAKAQQIMDAMGKDLLPVDYTNISKNVWPESWGAGTLHPYNLGAKAYAYLVYYKMKELGYLDD